MKTQLDTIRIGASLAIPMWIAAGTVGLAAWLFASGGTTYPQPQARQTHVVQVVDDTAAVASAAPASDFRS